MKWAHVCKAVHSALQCVAQNQALWKFPNKWGKVAGLLFRSCDLSYLSLTPLHFFFLFFFCRCGWISIRTFSCHTSTDTFPKMTKVCSEKQSMLPLPQSFRGAEHFCPTIIDFRFGSWERGALFMCLILLQGTRERVSHGLIKSNFSHAILVYCKC